jgi:hypothetical protein
MSTDTQERNEQLADKFDELMKDINPIKGSVKVLSTNSEGDLKASVIKTRESIMTTMSKIKDYYINKHGEGEWKKLQDIPVSLVTGINPNPKEPLPEQLPNNLKFLSRSETTYYPTPAFYKNLYETYYDNAKINATFLDEIDDVFPAASIPNMTELYKIFNVDLETQIDKNIDNSNVNERKTFYERQETNKMKFYVDALRKLYIRIFLILIFIKLYVYFLKNSISIKGVFIELLLLSFLFVFPILLASLITTYIPKNVYEYLPANIWVKNVE